MADNDTQLLSDDDIQALLDQAGQDRPGPESPLPEEGPADTAPAHDDVADATPLALRELPEPAGMSSQDAAKIDLLKDVKLNVRIELGRTEMLVEDVLRLADGSVVTLDRLAGDPVDILVNDRLVAKGEVLVLNDSFCVRIAEILPVSD